MIYDFLGKEEADLPPGVVRVDYQLPPHLDWADHGSFLRLLLKHAPVVMTLAGEGKIALFLHSLRSEALRRDLHLWTEGYNP